ncbi:Uncharacterised protein [Neisseria lactamica]|nr:Uncharacterised protein [Neisseria lactamica]SUA15999.1 Uncharacterised protein [Neisseria lactamica]
MIVFPTVFMIDFNLGIFRFSINPQHHTISCFKRVFNIFSDILFKMLFLIKAIKADCIYRIAGSEALIEFNNIISR